MRRVIVLAMLVAFAACSGGGVEIISTQDLPPDIYGASGGERSTTVVLYMVDVNRLVRVARTGRAQGTEAEVAVRGLLAGPTATELGRGITTEIPDATELLGVTIEDGVARVNLDIDFQVIEDAEDVQEYIIRTAQLVWTLDELADVRSVQLLIDGQPSVVYDQFRREVGTPVARGRYQRFEPRSEKPVSESAIDI